MAAKVRSAGKVRTREYHKKNAGQTVDEKEVTGEKRNPEAKEVREKKDKYGRKQTNPMGWQRREHKSTIVVAQMRGDRTRKSRTERRK